MLEPRRAPVIPRIRCDDGGTLPLEHELLPLLEEHARGAVAILGTQGSGKTTALQHLACLVSERAHIVVLDEPTEADVTREAAERLVLYTGRRLVDLRHIATFRLADWRTDDFIEYLQAQHPTQSASVMARLSVAEGAGLLGGIPELWRVVLDEMAADARLTRLSDALQTFLALRLSPEQLQRAQRGSLAVVLSAADVVKRTADLWPRAKRIPPVGLDDEELAQLQAQGCDEHVGRLLRHSAVRLLLAREHVLADLRAKAPCPYFLFRMSQTFVRMLGSAVLRDPLTLEHVRHLAGQREPQSMAASVLHATGVRWRPPENTSLDLSGGFFANSDWSDARLALARLDQADLRRAELGRAVLEHCSLAGTNLSHSTAAYAGFIGCKAPAIDFSHADVRAAIFKDCVMRRANFTGADLREAVFEACDLNESDLRDANCTHADLTNALLSQTRIDGTLLAGAKLNGANLRDTDLRRADFGGTVQMREARLNNANLEEIELQEAPNFERADLGGALLTASVMRGASFKRASLRAAKLAHIDWEGADLREADFTGAQFHLGSSRAGLVHSPVACEGSRTGFYTDEFTEQGFKAPEQIRKANLRGADLRSAIFGGADFYLVDLRDAKLDPSQERYLRRCGAILEHRVPPDDSGA